MLRRRLLSMVSLGFLGGARAQAATPPRIWLAHTYQPNIDVRDFWVSEKLDGVRGYWDGQQLLTRGGHPLRPPAWFIQGWPITPVEGELWAGRGRFSTAVSVIQQLQANDADWQKLRFMVFDRPQHPGIFTERLQAYVSWVAELGAPFVEAVPQVRLTTKAELQQLLEDKVRAGAEGLMLRRAEALYQPGRSSDHLKLKPHDDAEARVVAHVAGTGQFKGGTGALWVQTPQGLTFKLGSGLNAEQRQNPPALGSWVTYRYRGLTDQGVPRFASFVRVQPDVSF